MDNDSRRGMFAEATCIFAVLHRALRTVRPEAAPDSPKKLPVPAHNAAMAKPRRFGRGPGGPVETLCKKRVEMENVRCAEITRFLFAPNQLVWFGALG
jgi:hypothetical protein